MANRRELIAELEQLGRELGEEISTDRLSTTSLAERVAALRARIDQRTKPPAEPIAQEAQESPVRTRAWERLLEPDLPRTPPPIIHDQQPVSRVVDGATDGAEGGPPPLEFEHPKPPRAPYHVAPGRSIVANGRVIGPMKPVKASDFSGGQTDLDDLILRGAVVRRA